ncbi:hypothetical protein [Ferrimicrobium acidiphilum]|uniref:hypothetical protein n=1 Tax=Ferrimicrobium acidiphilum TaxID=121039 RepID=UPI0023F17C56|nr:hypothetical protein [Ferrimicrobium acidiphilum]
MKANRDFDCPELVFPCEYIVVDAWEADHIGEIPWSCLKAMGIKRTPDGAIWFRSDESARMKKHKHYVACEPQPKEFPTGLTHWDKREVGG